MIIDVSGIPAGGTLAVNESGTADIPASFGFGDSAKADVAFRGLLTREDYGFALSGVMDVSVQTFCAVCLEPVKHAFSRDVSELFSRKPKDIDEWLVLDDGIDLYPAFRDICLTSLPGRVVCKEGCAPDSKYL